jgi:soluble lytic murein transglycosylase-like protein
MPATARALGVNPWDPVQNLYGSIRYLRGNLDRFGWEQPHLALAAYNAGRGAVTRYEGIPPYAETQWYVANVSSLYRRLLAIQGKIPELRRSSGVGLGED